ncbi:MAG TPA: hypothetical protein VFQ50_03680 [Flavobacterium sp.]|nr:hypothetical protein [Flavobacterium sp.]
MKKFRYLRLLFAVAASSLLLACSTNRIKGTASDRTGTNGATNGTGKIAK